MTLVFWGMCFCVLRHDDPGPSREWHRRHYHAGVKVLVFIWFIWIPNPNVSNDSLFELSLQAALHPAIALLATQVLENIFPHTSARVQGSATIQIQWPNLWEALRTLTGHLHPSYTSLHRSHWWGAMACTWRDPCRPCCHASARQVSAPGQLACRDPLPITWQKGSLRSDLAYPARSASLRPCPHASASLRPCPHASASLRPCPHATRVCIPRAMDHAKVLYIWYHFLNCMIHIYSICYIIL